MWQSNVEDDGPLHRDRSHSAPAREGQAKRVRLAWRKSGAAWAGFRSRRARCAMRTARYSSRDAGSRCGTATVHRLGEPVRASAEAFMLPTKIAALPRTRARQPGRRTPLFRPVLGRLFLRHRIGYFVALASQPLSVEAGLLVFAELHKLALPLDNYQFRSVGGPPQRYFGLALRPPVALHGKAQLCFGQAFDFQPGGV